MKLSLNRLLETSKFLSTKAGQELQDFVIYVSDLGQNCVKALRNGLNFSDNFDAQMLALKLTHNVEQNIKTTKSPIGVIPLRVNDVNTAYCGITAFRWWLNSKGELVVIASIAGTPSAAVEVTMVVLF